MAHSCFFTLAGAGHYPRFSRNVNRTWTRRISVIHVPFSEFHCTSTLLLYSQTLCGAAFPFLVFFCGNLSLGSHRSSLARGTFCTFSEHISAPPFGLQRHAAWAIAGQVAETNQLIIPAAKDTLFSWEKHTHTPCRVGKADLPNKANSKRVIWSNTDSTAKCIFSFAVYREHWLIHNQ